MAKAKNRKQAPAITPEARENQLISYAIDMAEEQLINKTAPTQVLTHYLKLATTKTELEKEKLRRENVLLEAKANAIASEKETAELYAQALNAMREYNGEDVEEFDEEL